MQPGAQIEPYAAGVIRARLFYGWWIVLSAAVGLFLGPIPIVVFSFGVFLKPLVQEFHSGRGEVSLAITLYSVILAFGLPFAGRLSDRLGARRVILRSTFLVGTILLSSFLLSGRIWQLYAFYSALGVVSCGVAAVSYCHLISQWFDRYRGLALGLMMAGLGIGGIVMPVTAQYLIAEFGWRTAFGIVGAAILLVSLPLLAAVLKDKPESMGLLPDGGYCDIPMRARPAGDPV